MSKPPKHSRAAVKAYPAPVRTDFKTPEAYALACQKVSDARIAFDSKKEPVKQGTSKEASDKRKQLFAYAYIANGHNGTQAAIAVGCPKKGARVTATRWLTDANVKAILAAETKKAVQIAGLSVERTLQELARLAYSDVRRLYDENGNIKAIHLLDDDTAACIAGVEFEEINVGGLKVGRTSKLKIVDKKGSLDMAMRHHGQYEKDNNQLKGDSLPLLVVFGK